MPSLRRQCLARFYRYLMAGFEVTINGRFWVTAEANPNAKLTKPVPSGRKLTNAGVAQLARAYACQA